MPTLQERLSDLADDAPVLQHPGDLWERGRALHRRRRRGTVLIAAAATVAVALLLGAAWQVTLPDRPPQPAEGTGALPDRLFEPSPWLPGTDEEGPLGRLAATITADRGGWLGSDPALVGVSATTGEYRFLDLPDAADPGGFEATSLSPDGRHVAYWTTGETSASPNTAAGPVVAGLAVYDSLTGEVQRHPIATEHGLDPATLLWADARRLVAGYGVWAGGEDDSDMDQSTGLAGAVLVWDLAEPEPRRLEGIDGTDAVWAGQGRLLTWLGTYRVVDLAGGEEGVRFRIAPNLSTPVLSDDGRRLAVQGGSGTPSAVLSGRVPAGGGRATLRTVPSTSQTFAVLGWVGEDRLALRRRESPQSRQHVVDLVEVTTGESERLLDFPEGDLGSDQLATDLLDRPTFDAPEPPRPMDPRLVAGLCVVLVGVGLSAVGRWRRRVRA